MVQPVIEGFIAKLLTTILDLNYLTMYHQATILDGCLKQHQQKGKVFGISENCSILACKAAYNLEKLW